MKSPVATGATLEEVGGVRGDALRAALDERAL